MKITRHFAALSAALTVAALLAGFLSPASAQMRATGQGTLSVTTSTANQALPNSGPTLLLQNTGSNDLRYALGSSAVTASATTGFLLKSGQCYAFATNNAGFIAAIGIGGSTTLEITQGNGIPALGSCSAASGGGGGGGLSVTDQSTWTNGTSAFTPNGGVFNDSATALTAGNQGTVRLNANREMHVDCDLGNKLCASINSGVGTPGSASPATDLAVGANAVNTEPSATTNGNNAKLITDLVGKLIMLPYANPENLGVGQITSAMTGTTSTALSGMGAPGAGLRWYITSCTISNSHATVGTLVLLQDGSGGATIWQFPAAAAYGGAAPPLPTPIRQPTANTGIFAVNATTGSSTFVSCTGYKGV